MSRLATFFCGAALGGAAMFGGMKYHIVRAEDGFHMIPKLTAGIDQVYVDIRGFEVQDWAEHRSLAAAIIKAKQQYLLKDAAEQSLQDGLQTALEFLASEAE